MLRVSQFLVSLLLFWSCANALAFERADISKVPSAPPSPMIRGQFTYQNLNRTYALFSPPQTSAAKRRPLLVFLHGCVQDAEEIAAVTHLNELAIRENFFVLYPEQEHQANALGCWNWFEPVNIEAKSAASTLSNERDLIVALTQFVAEKVQANTDAIFVAGFSAGGAMAVNLASCYPDLFTGVGVFSGLPYAAAGSVLEATKAMKLGSSTPAQVSAERAFQCSMNKTGRPLHVLIVHGKSDLAVSVKNARQVLDHFEAFNDLRDDGILNQSTKYDLKNRQNMKAKRNRHAYSDEHYSAETHGIAELVLVSNLGHAWSGGAEGYDYSNPKRPDASEMLWSFMTSAIASKP